MGSSREPFLFLYYETMVAFVGCGIPYELFGKQQPYA